MSDKVIVMVCDLDDPKHGELNVLQSPKEASRHVESLLEAGFEQARIRVFNGDEMTMTVAHRPIVALVSGGSSSSGGNSGTSHDDHASEEESQEEVVVANTRSETREEVKAAPGTKNGLRFSTMFRPA